MSDVIAVKQCDNVHTAYKCVCVCAFIRNTEFPESFFHSSSLNCSYSMAMRQNMKYEPPYQQIKSIYFLLLYPFLPSIFPSFHLLPCPVLGFRIHILCQCLLAGGFGCAWLKVKVELLFVYLIDLKQERWEPMQTQHLFEDTKRISDDMA